MRKPTRSTVVRFEQAVYGSFPFWDKGYAVLAASPGVRPDWLKEFQAVCQRFGEPPRGVSGDGAMFTLRLVRGPWLIVGVCPQGHDDRGRPGALAFHGLFVTPREFRKAEFDPFRLTGALRCDWNAGLTALPSGCLEIAGRGAPSSSGSDLARRIAATLCAGRRVAMEASEPVGTAAHAAWCELPARIRRRSSVATLAFSNANRFDLVAFPKLASISLDTSYATAETLAEPRTPREGANVWTPGRRTVVAICSILAGALAVVALLRWNRSDRANALSTAPPSNRIELPATPPQRTAYPGGAPAPDERRRTVDALIEIAERFGIEPDAGFDPETDPADVMAVFAERLRYRGPLLTDEERTRLHRDGSPEALEASEWDDHIRHFRADRPLPADFARGPLRWQLDTLAWSFHTVPEPAIADAEAPHALADALAIKRAIHPNPLADQFPTLAEYERFLRRLPRR